MSQSLSSPRPDNKNVTRQCVERLSLLPDKTSCLLVPGGLVKLKLLNQTDSLLAPSHIRRILTLHLTSQTCRSEDDELEPLRRSRLCKHQAQALLSLLEHLITSQLAQLTMILEPRRLSPEPVSIANSLDPTMQSSTTASSQHVQYVDSADPQLQRA